MSKDTATAITCIAVQVHQEHPELRALECFFRALEEYDRLLPKETVEV
jgi:hypothetical protein